MKYTLILLSFCLFAFSGFAQQDPKAKQVLDQYAAKIKKAKAYRADFNIHSDNKQDGSVNDKKGSLAVKGKMYKLILDETEIYSDGATVWNYLKSSNELNITKAEKKRSKELLITDPSEIFSIYQKDFKYRYINQISYRGKECHEIDLTPKDLNVEYFRIKLFIDKVKNELVGMKYMTKMGVTHEISFTTMTLDAVIDDKEFKYDLSRHPNAEVNDLRF